MTKPKTTYTERAFRAALGRKILSVIVGRISADSVERWLDAVSVQGAVLPLTRRLGIMSGLHLVLGNCRK